MQKYRPGMILGWGLVCGSEHVHSSHLILNQTQYHWILIFRKYFCRLYDFNFTSVLRYDPSIWQPQQCSTKPNITFQQCVNTVTIISSYLNVSTLRGPPPETPNSGIPYHITPADELTLSMLRTEKQHVFWTELFHCVSWNILVCNNNFHVLRNFGANIP
jgi:hypothetical protein